METVLTGWVEVCELRYDAADQTLTVIYRSNETRVLYPVTQEGFDRFVGKPLAVCHLPAMGAKSRWGIVERTVRLARQISILTTAGGGDDTAIADRLRQQHTTGWRSP
jgi:hypothetical protein